LKDAKSIMKKLVILFLLGGVSCSLFDGMRKNSFAYNDQESLPLFIPKGFKKMNLQTDAAGNKTQVFSYSNGGELYFYFGDSTKEYRSIDTTMNIPKYYPENVAFYKGQDSSNGLFWRESRYKNFKFGYKNVSVDREGWFDSSLNYAAWQLLVK
jgi:hypothetical protein